MIVCHQCQQQFQEPAPRYCGRCGADLRPSDPRAAAAGGGASAEAGNGDPMIGRVVGGRYRLLERLGVGGMGVVYRVEHTAMGKIAALKMLHPSLSMERELVKRFRTEARAVSLLSHPNIVQVFDFGESDGALFMVMELVRGEDLAGVLDREGPMPLKRALPLLMQICEALAEAHEAGVVHRDLKPENIIVYRGRDGRETAKVLDFGLAKLRERSSQVTGSTGKGIMIGTPNYMSPEQIRGDPLDRRSDLYSFGALAYRLLSGEYPFDGKSAVAVLTAHLTDPLVPMSQKRRDLPFDPEVERIVEKCLARLPANRFGSADEVRAALAESERALSLGMRTPAAVEAVERSQPPGSQLSREDFNRFEQRLRIRRRALVGAGSVALVLAAGLGAWMLVARDGDRPLVEEVEPNDDARQANPIAIGQAVRGRLGTASDRDVFRFRVPRGPVVMRFELSGVPSVDSKLAVFDSTGERIADGDGGGVGDPEVIPNLRGGAGEYYVEVRAGSGANATDPYSLRVIVRPLVGDEETEPDDTPATAIAIPLGKAVPGYLGRAGDVDFFYPRGEPGGLLEGSVSGVPGVDVRIVALPPASQVKGDPAAVPGAQVFDTGGPGAPETMTGVPWPSGGAAPLIVVMRKDAPSVVGGARPSMVGGDAPYSLILKRSKP